MEGEASYAEISNFLTFQKSNKQLEDMQYKGRLGASQAKQHEKDVQTGCPKESN